ncbi:DUF1905 domain-containing protein [Microbacterium terricola]|uniref:DUF1905 domain-containing protein n=1 Tax=Microbacterium terricola TaxID=344163 RepID=A0ABM8E337_9MICO|nr:DUF1905 domain-containing protein [Microbacterium terricola]UYK39938.1 DUF1905 domain-containing protein [Microbacterium terricola]BDV32383.1 hypothetical protein Microterr_30430 [Microbacterium terricola]
MSRPELRFDAPIGVSVKGEIWSCVEIPGSAEFFGTGKAVRVDAHVDEIRLENVGAMVTGTGGHMISLSAKVRTQLGKDIGDTVRVVLTRS